jgi:hypothetical protein
MENSIIGLAILEWVIKLAAGVGAFVAVVVAVVNYRAQTRLKQAEWLKSLFEKFFENSNYKEVRKWLEYGQLHSRLTVEDQQLREINEEKFTDFLNFFEFIAVLYARKHLTGEQVSDVFDYYLKKIKSDEDCQLWIDQYSFEKLKALLVYV